MNPLVPNIPLLSQPFSCRTPIEFVEAAQPRIEIPSGHRSWDWPTIQRLLDEVLPLTAKRPTKELTVEIERLMILIHPLIPDSKGQLRTIVKQAKHYYTLARFGAPHAKAALAPYRVAVRALGRAARQKLAVLLCRPNFRDWDLRAYRLFLELQQNLGRFPRLHFLTLTIRGDVSYDLFRDRIKRFKRQLKNRGFGALPIVALHPNDGSSGRLHAHMLVWSLRTRSAKQETADLAGIKQQLRSRDSLFGKVYWDTVRTRQSFLKVFAYMAWNYSVTLSAPRGAAMPIPKNARVVSNPKQVREGRCWVRVGPISLVTPAKTAWRKAVARYSAVHGRSPEDARQWIWLERRLIKEYIEPEPWSDASVTGLDGYTYRVTPEGEDHLGNETYRLSSDERGTFFLTEHGLEELAKLQAIPGVFSKNERLDLTTGVTAYCYEVLGFYIFDSQRRLKRRLTGAELDGTAA